MFDEQNTLIENLTESFLKDYIDIVSRNTEDNIVNYRTLLKEIQDNNDYIYPLITTKLLRKYYKNVKRLKHKPEITFPVYYLDREPYPHDSWARLAFHDLLSKHVSKAIHEPLVYKKIFYDSTISYMLDLRTNLMTNYRIPTLKAQSPYELFSNHDIFEDQDYNLSPSQLFAIFDAPLISSISNISKEHEKCDKYLNCVFPNCCALVRTCHLGNRCKENNSCSFPECCKSKEESLVNDHKKLTCSLPSQRKTPTMCKMNFFHTINSDSYIGSYFEEKANPNLPPRWGIKINRDNTTSPIMISATRPGFLSARISLYARFIVRDGHSNKSLNKISFQTRPIVDPNKDGTEPKLHYIDQLKFSPQDAWYYEISTGISFCSRIASFLISLSNDYNASTKFWIDHRNEIFVRILERERSCIVNCPAPMWRISVVENIIYSFNKHIIDFINEPDFLLSKSLQDLFRTIKFNIDLSNREETIVHELIDFGCDYFSAAFSFYFTQLGNPEPNSDCSLSYIQFSHNIFRKYYLDYATSVRFADILLNQSDKLYSSLCQLCNNDELPADLLHDMLKNIFLRNNSISKDMLLYSPGDEYIYSYTLCQFLINNPHFENSDYDDSDNPQIKQFHSIVERSIFSFHNEIVSSLSSESFFSFLDSFLDQYLRSIFNSQDFKYLMFCKDEICTLDNRLERNINKFINLDNKTGKKHSELKNRNPCDFLFQDIHSALFPDGSLDFGCES